MKNYSIKDIESMSVEEVEKLACEKWNIKDYSVYLVDFSGYFGLSAVVYYGKHQIRHANDYQLHHGHMNREELRKWYIETMNNKLFTADELATINNYDDLRAKEYYVRNYHGMRENSVSIWFVGSDEERAERQQLIKSMFYSPVSFAYYHNREFVEELNGLLQLLETAKSRLENDFDFWVSAFVSEMFNHEYGINWQADYDTISAFARVDGVRDYENLTELFNAAKFSKTQRRAYESARREYYAKANF